MDYIFYIIIAIIIAFILSVLRPYKIINQSESGVITNSVGWCLVIYGLLLGFSITIFYGRYIEIRNFIATEVTNLSLIYNFFKVLPNSEEVVKSIKNYVFSVINEFLPSVKNREYNENTEKLYKIMDQEIIKYIQENPNSPFNNNILIRLSTDNKLKILSNEIKNGDYYIGILIFLFIVIVFLLWCSEIADFIVQFIVDLCLLVILLSSLYFCIILNNVFNESPIAVKMESYNDLLKEIENDVIF